MIFKSAALLSCALLVSGSEAFNRLPHSAALAFHPSSSLPSIYDLRGGSDSPQDDVSEPSDVATVTVSSEPAPVQVPPSVPEPVVVAEQTTVAPAATKKTSNPKLANAIERTGPALALLGAIFLLIKITGENGLLYGLVPLMQIGMYYESTDIIEAFHQKKSVKFNFEKWWWFTTVFSCTTLRFLGGVGSLKGAYMDLACFGMVSLSLVMAVLGMANHPAAGADMFRTYLGEVASSHFALIFLVGQSSFFIKTIQSFGMEWVIYPALLVVVNDTMAYVFGMLMGKHKLIPRLSPKKTVEGFIGGGISTCAIAYPLLKYFANSIFSVNGKAGQIIAAGNADIVKHSLMLGMYISFIAPFGGFLASAVKRAHGAKDFGKLIPGHGGVVDRFDCQIVTAPFVFLYLKSCMAA